MRYLILVSLFLFSCGVKTAPRSTVIETRPVVPFRESAPKVPVNEPEKSSEQDLKKGGLQDGKQN